MSAHATTHVEEAEHGTIKSFSVVWIILLVALAGFGLFIPNNPSLTGLTLTCQSVALTLANPLNLVFSNGNSFSVGL